jgi:uncharacterized membrane protein YfcA
VSGTRPPLAACACIGALGGLAAGLLGIGGGLIVVPLLTAWLHVPLKRAVGTSLLVVLVTSCVGVATEAIVAPANLRWAAALPLALGALVGAVLGAKLVARTSPRVLGMLLAALMLVSAVKLAGLVPHWESASSGALGPVALLVAHALAGLAAGVLAAMFGVGGGILAVPALAWLHPAWEFQACRATSLLMIIPTSVLAATLHHKLQHLDPAIGRALAPAAALGAVAGVLLANSVPGRPLEIAFAALLIVSAAQIVRRALRPEQRG